MSSCLPAYRLQSSLALDGLQRFREMCPKARVLKAWPPACVTIECGGALKGMAQQENIRSLSGTLPPLPLVSQSCGERLCSATHTCHDVP